MGGGAGTAASAPAGVARADVLGLLAAALARRGLQRRVRLVAVLNDSVGTFLSGLADGRARA